MKKVLVIPVTCMENWQLAGNECLVLLADGLDFEHWGDVPPAIENQKAAVLNVNMVNVEEPEVFIIPDAHWADMLEYSWAFDNVIIRPSINGLNVTATVDFGEDVHDPDFDYVSKEPMNLAQAVQSLAHPLPADALFTLDD